MEEQRKTEKNGESRAETVMRVFGILLWIVLAIVLFFNRDKITVETVLTRTPENPWAAVPLFLLFFGLKGMSMVLYAGILYTASGLVFTLPAAMAVNLVGTAVMVTVPWFAGRLIGGEAVERFDAKYPAAARWAAFRQKNEWGFSLGIRLFGGLPSDPLSLYLGAAGLDWLPMVAGGVIGYLPKALTLPLIARHADNPTHPVFLVSSALALLFAFAPAFFLLGLSIRKWREKKAAGAEDKKTDPTGGDA